MSLGIAFKGPEGIVLAADSRVTLHGQIERNGQQAMLPASFDNATKLLKVAGQDYVGVVTFGVGAFGQYQPRTPHSFIPEFEAELNEEDVGRLPVEEFAERLGEFYQRQWDERMPDDYDVGDMMFLVGGYDEGDAYGKLFEVAIPSDPEPTEKHGDDHQFGPLWGGQRQITDRVIQGFDEELLGVLQQSLGLDANEVRQLNETLRQNMTVKIPYQFLPLQDCVDLSIFLIKTTSELQDFQVDVRGVGGAIDVATITRTDGYSPIQRKKVTGQVDGGTGRSFSQEDSDG